MTQMIRATTDEHWQTARELFEEYAASLGVDLSFQNFDEELRTLARQYGAPEGCLLLACEDGQPMGCVALRRMDTRGCELKRLYVKPQFRHRKLGQLLVETMLEEAQKLRYSWVRLDTLPTMTAAQQLYRSVGFREIAPYRFNPIEGTIFMELDLPGEAESKPFQPTAKTTLKRLPKRGVFDREAVYKILDEAFICHVGFVVDGQPFVIPTGYARVDDTLYIHGSAASRMLRALATGIDVCVTVTLLDGLVLARSAFHHSVNYRSVVVLGKARLVESNEEKMTALEAFTEQVVRGRWAEIRWPNEQELKATSVLALPLEEVSAKVRTGPPLDDEEDMNWPVWAGVVPLSLAAAAPIPAPDLRVDVATPSYALQYNRERSA